MESSSCSRGKLSSHSWLRNNTIPQSIVSERDAKQFYAAGNSHTLSKPREGSVWICYLCGHVYFTRYECVCACNWNLVVLQFCIYCGRFYQMSGWDVLDFLTFHKSELCKALSFSKWCLYIFRFWTIIPPLFILVAIALGLVGYVGATLLLVPAPDSLHTLTGWEISVYCQVHINVSCNCISDEYTQMATPEERCLGNHDTKSIPPIRDIPITVVNKRMYGI